MLYGMGMLELGVTFSFEQFVIDHEIARMVKRVVQGIKVNDYTLGVDVIKKVGAANNFIKEKHTRELKATEQSKALLIDRRMRPSWEAKGGKDMTARAREFVCDIIKNHKPEPLPEGALQTIREIVAEADKREAGK